MSIFSGNSVHNYNRAWLNEARNAINYLTEDDILNSSDEEIAERLAARFVPELPRVDRERVTVDRGSGNSGYGGTVHFYEFFIPFEGPREPFSWQPSTATLGGIPLEVHAKELVYRASANDRDAEAKVDRLLDDVDRHLATMQRDFQNLPREIRDLVQQLVPPKREAIVAAREGVTKFRFKMRRRDDAPETYVAPEVKRKAVSAPRAASAKPAADPDPILDEAEYQHIMKVMDNMTHVMERSPKAFSTLGEEDIRTHFLFQLNGQYEGQATGETFNAEGKTDILIRVDDKNIFIGECKFWKGEGKSDETIDQLLGYLTWRDAKTALIWFNTNKGFTDMIKTAVDAVKKHPNYKSGPVKESETRYRYVMRNKNDPDKEVIMTMMLYDIPR